jgi:hypothetical protein
MNPLAINNSFALVILGATFMSSFSIAKGRFIAASGVSLKFAIRLPQLVHRPPVRFQATVEPPQSRQIRQRYGCTGLVEVVLA